MIAETDDVRQLLPYIDIIKCDVRDMPMHTLLRLAPQFKATGKKLLAEKVEPLEQSLMDTLFGVSMQDILEQIPVVDEVADALPQWIQNRTMQPRNLKRKQR